MKPLIAELMSHRPVLVCGAIGTELQARGVALGASPEEWNLSHAADVEAVSRAYVEAGCRVLLANTFGANRINLSMHCPGESVEEINRAGVDIARRSAGESVYVFGCLGPINKS